MSTITGLGGAWKCTRERGDKGPVWSQPNAAWRGAGRPGRCLIIAWVAVRLHLEAVASIIFNYFSGGLKSRASPGRGSAAEVRVRVHWSEARGGGESLLGVGGAVSGQPSFKD